MNLTQVNKLTSGAVVQVCDIMEGSTKENSKPIVGQYFSK